MRSPWAFATPADRTRLQEEGEELVATSPGPGLRKVELICPHCCNGAVAGHDDDCRRKDVVLRKYGQSEEEALALADEKARSA